MREAGSCIGGVSERAEGDEEGCMKGLFNKSHTHAQNVENFLFIGRISFKEEGRFGTARERQNPSKPLIFF